MTVLRLYLSRRIKSLRKITRAHLEAIRRLVLDSGPSDSIDLPGGWRAYREYNLLRVVNTTPADAGAFSVPLMLDGITIVEAARYQFEASTIAADGEHASMPGDLRIALFDAAEIRDSGLVVRNFIRGDRISPLGMVGVRKVKDVFIDRKVPRGNRSRFPIVTIGGEVAWLPGIARASIARITGATERILRVEAREIGV